MLAVIGAALGFRLASWAVLVAGAVPRGNIASAYVIKFAHPRFHDWRAPLVAGIILIGFRALKRGRTDLVTALKVGGRSVVGGLSVSRHNTWIGGWANCIVIGVFNWLHTFRAKLC